MIDDPIKQYGSYELLLQKISAVKRFKYLIAINHINVIVNSQLIAINRNSFFYAKYPLISLSH